MLKLAKKITAAILSISIILFTLLAILGIWGVLGPDIAWKSLSTLGVIFVAAVLTLVVLKIIESEVGKK